MGCIYYHKNKLNGALYIGKSKYEPDMVLYGRWGRWGEGYRSNTYFWRAIKKYGWSNFEHGIFEQNISDEQLGIKEKEYIAKYHTYIQDPLYQQGYNLTPGGEKSFNTWWPEEDLWLVENYTVYKTRDTLVDNFKKAFLNTYHSDAAIKARLKTLRLSKVENVDYWTEQEELFLYKHWATASMEFILQSLPNRNYETIRKHALSLGLNRKLANPPYTKDEDAILLREYESSGPKKCQELIQENCGSLRTIQSIHSHANKTLKLNYHKKYTVEVGFDLEAFKMLYYQQGVTACMKEFNLTEMQVRNIAGKYKFKRNKATIRTGIQSKTVY